jgi:hypothetical protein
MAGPEYTTWQSMNQRCYNPNRRGYHRYGGRGIKVAERWRGDSGYRSFLADMGRKPSPEYSLHRKDNDGDYTPENCCWATSAEQARNRCDSRMPTFNGKTMCMKDWAKEIGVKYWVLEKRLNRLHWPLEKALRMRLVPRKHRHAKLLRFKGETKSITEWARKLNFNEASLRDRLNSGWSIREALTVVPRKMRSQIIHCAGQKRTLREWSQLTGISYQTLWQRLEVGWSIRDALETPLLH